MMSSPFPGMDPYLEGEMWQEFHETLASAIRAQLLQVLPEKYIALLAKRYVLYRPSIDVFEPPEQRVFYPDAHVAESGGRLSEPAPALAPPAVRITPIELISPIPEEIPQLSVEIRDVAERRLVTVIEILSPVNKIGEGASEYDRRRMEILRTRTHLLEIDLIRRGQRIDLIGELPTAPYYIYLSRVRYRPTTQVWPVQLADPLPTVPVPLLPPDPDVSLDLQEAVDACFDLVGYERLLDYSVPPPPPELSEEEAAWVAERLQAGKGVVEEPGSE